MLLRLLLRESSLLLRVRVSTGGSRRDFLVGRPVAAAAVLLFCLCQ